MRKLPPGIRHIRRPPRRGPEWTRWLGVGLVAVAVQVASDPDYPIPRQSAPVSSADRVLPPLIEPVGTAAIRLADLEFGFRVGSRGGAERRWILEDWSLQLLSPDLEPIGGAQAVTPNCGPDGLYRVRGEGLGEAVLAGLRAAGGGFWIVEARWHRSADPGDRIAVGSAPVPLRIIE